MDLPWERTVDPLSVLEVLLAGDGLPMLLSLLPEHDRRFKRRRYGAIQLIDVDMRSLILDWVRGVELSVLADRYLADVTGEDADAFRFEQLASFLTKVCEHHLPWTLAIVIDWIHQETGVELCPGLPAHLHYGTPTQAAVALMQGGVRSRRLSVAVGERAVNEGVPDENLRAWLAQMGLADWRSEFDAAPASSPTFSSLCGTPRWRSGNPCLTARPFECRAHSRRPYPLARHCRSHTWSTRSRRVRSLPLTEMGLLAGICTRRFTTT